MAHLLQFTDAFPTGKSYSFDECTCGVMLSRRCVIQLTFRRLLGDQGKQMVGHPQNGCGFMSTKCNIFRKVFCTLDHYDRYVSSFCSSDSAQP